MSCKVCKDLKFNEDVKAVYFDGTANSLRELQNLIVGTNQVNLNTLHTKINWWCIRYQDGSIVWRKNKCFEAGYKIVK